MTPRRISPVNLSRSFPVDVRQLAIGTLSIAAAISRIYGTVERKAAFQFSDVITRQEDGFKRYRVIEVAPPTVPRDAKGDQSPRHRLPTTDLHLPGQLSRKLSLAPASISETDDAFHGRATHAQRSAPRVRAPGAG